MRPASHELVELLRQARGGCPRAIGQLVERYSEPVLRVIRRHLSQRLRSEFDPADLLQSVWCDFFSESLSEQAFLSSEQLFGYLRQMASIQQANPSGIQRRSVAGQLRRRLS